MTHSSEPHRSAQFRVGSPVSWIEIVDRPEGVLAVFDGATPPLTGVEVHSVIFGHSGDVRLVFDLRDFPNDPPAKWANQGYNTVQLTLACAPVRDIRLTGWARQITADIAVDRIGDRVALRVDSPTMTLALTSDFVSVLKVAAYLNDPQTAC